jgi:pilus assembly protein CpaE
MAILCTAQKRPDPALVASIGAGVRIVPSPAAADELLRRDPKAVLVVMGPDIDLDAAIGFAAALRLRRPVLGVVLVRHTLDLDVFTAALRSGVREVVALSDLEGLAAACKRSRMLSISAQLPSMSHDETPGKIITVFATKGGCGKTTMATNLAVCLHGGGSRRVCLVDLDLAFGDVAISLRLVPKRTLADAVAMSGELDETGVAGLLTRFRPGLECVLAPVEPGDAERVPAALVGKLLEVLRGMFDYVVVDTPPQFNEHVLKALDCSDVHVLLTTPDIPTLKNLRLTIDMLDLLNYPKDSRLIVLNREDPEVGVTVTDVEQVIKSEVTARVPSSTAVTAAVNRGMPIVLDQPDHRISVVIREFALHHITGLAPTPPPRRRRFLARAMGRGRHEAQ